MNGLSLFKKTGLTKYNKFASALIILSVIIPQAVLASTITPQTVIDLTNSERVKLGQTTLNMSIQLVEAAQAKAQNMVVEGYFDHYGPNSETPWQYILAADYDYQYAGENLAMNFSQAENMVKAWMKSETHRDNILDPHYQEIGVAVANGVIEGKKTTLVVQMFGTKPETLIESISSKISVVDYVSDLLGISETEK